MFFNLGILYNNYLFLCFNHKRLKSRVTILCVFYGLALLTEISFSQIYNQDITYIPDSYSLKAETLGIINGTIGFGSYRCNGDTVFIGNAPETFIGGDLFVIHKYVGNSYSAESFHYTPREEVQCPIYKYNNIIFYEWSYSLSFLDTYTHIQSLLELGYIYYQDTCYINGGIIEATIPIYNTALKKLLQPVMLRGRFYYFYCEGTNLKYRYMDPDHPEIGWSETFSKPMDITLHWPDSYIDIPFYYVDNDTVYLFIDHHTGPYESDLRADTVFCFLGKYYGDSLIGIDHFATGSSLASMLSSYVIYHNEYTTIFSIDNETSLTDDSLVFWYNDISRSVDTMSGDLTGMNMIELSSGNPDSDPFYFTDNSLCKRIAGTDSLIRIHIPASGRRGIQALTDKYAFVHYECGLDSTYLVLYYLDSIIYNIPEETIIKPDRDEIAVFPNPFNSNCFIKVPPGTERLTIYNILGNSIKDYELITNQVNWNGMDNKGKDVENGIYFLIAKGTYNEILGKQKILMIK